NKTKKLTQGAMMLAIVGAVILIDRMIAYMFTELIVLLMPVVIIMYSTMHSLKDGVLLSVGMAIISFLLGSLQYTYLIYVPVSIATALIYAYGIRRNYDKRTLLFLAVAAYAVGELIATFVVYPLLGFPVRQMMEEYKLAFNQMSSFSGMNYSEVFAAAGLDFSNILFIIFIVSTIIMGATEGLLIHLLSIFLMKRFKIKDLGNTNIWDIKPNPLVAYIAMFFVIGLYFIRMFEPQSFMYNALLILGILSGVVLLYYGYLFIILFGVIVLHKNIGSFFVLLAFFVPVILMMLVICGFLYGSGPFRAYLELKLQQQKQ
ncbi:MAG: DUF2232 domain-containing protein, partial [Erysipelotrichaceae bacterium]|nr:DUF2232 domain-containing protein [Erysipelotrichaceae bacterium]